MLQEFLITQGGNLLTFAIYIGQIVGQDARDKAERRIIEGDISQIREFFAWVLEQNQNELLKKVFGMREELSSIAADVENASAILTNLDKAAHEHKARINEIFEHFNHTLNREPLSKLPLDSRLIHNQDILFRESVLDLISAGKDLLIHGQPGVGKTYLLYTYAQANNAWFVVSENADDVINAIKIKQPKEIIVDDAADKTAMLERILHYRKHSGIALRILAICWPFETEKLRRTLGISVSQQILVPLLKRDQMAELVKNRLIANNLRDENYLIREIVDQAEGRVGLAIRLIEVIALERKAEPLIKGVVHYAIIEETYSKLVDQNVMYVLAAFSVGGEHGMTICDVATALSLPETEIANTLRLLATGGIIKEVDESRVATRPKAFRYALLARELLTGGPFDHKKLYQKLFCLVQSKDLALETLIHAVARGANIDQEWLLAQVQLAETSSTWRLLASVNQNWCKKVFDRYPNAVSLCADAGLAFIPEYTLPKLLDAMTLDEREPHSNPDSPERKIDNWLQEFGDGIDVIARREQTFNLTLAWLRSGGAPSVAWKVLPKALSTRLHRTESDPGSGRTLSWQDLTLTMHGFQQLSPLWTKLIEVIIEYSPPSWKPIVSIMHEWLYPGRNSVEADIQAFARDSVQEFIHGISRCGLALPGLERWSKEYGFQLSITDPDFLAYVPPDSHDSSIDWQSLEDTNMEVARKLGHTWSKLPPEDVAKKILNYNQECIKWGIDYIPFEYAIVSTIAKHIDNHNAWLDLFFEYRLSSSTLKPLLEKILEINGPTSEEWLFLLIEDERYKFDTLATIMRLPCVTSELQEAAFEAIPTRIDRIAHITYGASEYWRNTLYQRAHGLLAVYYALCEFRHHKERAIGEFRDEWLDLLLRGLNDIDLVRADEFRDMKEMVAHFPEIRMPLVYKILQSLPHSYHNERTYEHLLDSLSDSEKTELLPALADVTNSDFVSRLIGDNLQLYEQLLACPELRQHHLSPLRGDPLSHTWQKKALLALRSAVPSADIACSVTRDDSLLSGRHSEVYEASASRFRELAVVEPELEEVARIAIAMQEKERERWMGIETQDELYGT